VTLVLRWRRPVPVVVTQWRGQTPEMLAAIALDPLAPIATVIGPPGAAGEPGLPGPQGPVGPTGPAGAIGPAGAAGPTGPKGDTGATGLAGGAGSQGAAGPIGPQGLKGDTGVTGATGPAGPMGLTGPVGPAGPQGPAGSPGTGTTGGAAILTTIEIDLGSVGRRSGRFAIAGSGWTAGKPVMIAQAPGPYSGKGTRDDEAQMDAIDIVGVVASATQIAAQWKSRTRVRGNYKFTYQIGG
jgi:hypothetical protein